MNIYLVDYTLAREPRWREVEAKSETDACRIVWRSHRLVCSVNKITFLRRA